jgi:hypothetical protein
MPLLIAVRWAIDAWQDDITSVTIANCWLKSRVLRPNYTPITRWQAERNGWQEAIIQENHRLATTIQQISTTLQAFKNQNRIKEAIPIQDYIDPVSER